MTRWQNLVTVSLIHRQKSWHSTVSSSIGKGKRERKRERNVSGRICFYFLDRNVSTRHSTDNASQHVPPLLPIPSPPQPFPRWSVLTEGTNPPPPFLHVNQRVNLPEFDERKINASILTYLPSIGFSYWWNIELDRPAFPLSRVPGEVFQVTGIIIETLFQLQKWPERRTRIFN